MDDLRLVYRGNQLLGDLFSKSVSSIRQLSRDEASAKGFYRFLHNDRVSEDDIIWNLSQNCRAACRDKYVICLQDTTEMNLSRHAGRIKKDDDIGTTNANKDKGLGFFLHPSFVVDAGQGIPYGYATVKVWNRPLAFHSKHERRYSSLPVEQKESYKWIEVSENTKTALGDVVKGMVIVQDREGDMYEQFALIPDHQTDLLVRARSDRRLADGSKLFACLSGQPSQGSYELVVEAKKGRPKRKASIQIRYREVELLKTAAAGKDTAPSLKLWLIEATEAAYSGKDAICWRLLTTLPLQSTDMARMCVEWYSWRWMVEEVFKLLKKEGYHLEGSELERASCIRKLSLLILEVIVKLFLMRLAYAEPEIELDADTCFSAEEQQCLEQQIPKLEGKTQKQKNPYALKDLKRYVWAIARMGGWKGYESKRHPGLTTLYIGLNYFKATFEGWQIHRNVSTR